MYINEKIVREFLEVVNEFKDCCQLMEDLLKRLDNFDSK